jgi:uncharacterized Zn finger protein (UPF0148 family)
VSLNRVPCPECGAGLTSPTGFAVGQNVRCPKCETYFTVEDPATAASRKPVKAAVAGDEDYDQPKKKRRAVTEDDEDAGRSYKNSPARYAILGVLVCVMVGLGVMLYLKKRDEGKDDNTAGDRGSNPPAELPKQDFPIIPGGPAGAAGGGPKKNPLPKGVTPPKNTPPKKDAGGGGVGLPFLGGGAALSGPEAAAKLKQYQKQIVGTWKAKLGGDATAELVYRDDGTFTDTLTTGGTPKTVSGTWTADSVIAGGKGVLITRTVAGARTTVKAEFEGDELLHDTQDRGTVGTFRK